MSLTSKVISMALKKFPSVVRGGRRAVSKAKKFQKNLSFDNVVIDTSRKRLSKELLSDAGFKRYQSNQIFSHNKKIKQLNKERQYLVDEHLDINKATAGQDPHLKVLTRKIRDVEDKIKAEVDARTYAYSPKFRNVYEKIVKHKIKYTPAKMVDKTSDESLAFYVPPKGSTMTRKLRESSEFTHPFRSSRNPNIYTFMDKGADYGKYGKTSTAKSILGKIAIKRGERLGSKISSGTHEFKHSVQEALKGYRDKTKALVPHVDVPNVGKVPKLVDYRMNKMVEANTQSHLLKGKGLSKAVEDAYKEWVGDAHYLTRPHEVSARLTQHRTGSKIANKLADNFYKLSGKNKRLVLKTGYRPPGYYSDLMEIFGTKRKMDKALKEAWAVAPISLMGIAEKE